MKRLALALALTALTLGVFNHEILVVADHEDVAVDTYSVNGITVLGDIDLGKLSVCHDCGYTVVDEPQYHGAAAALNVWGNDELVLGVSYNGVAKAYPLQTLAPVRFHVVNDLFNGTPLAVSFCPLCFSAVVFESPTINGQVLKFATAGLYSRDLVMYDNVTFTLWQQFTGEPIVGEMVGQTGLLHRVPADIVPLSDWAAAHPDTVVYVDPTLSLPRRSNEAVPQLEPIVAIASGTRNSSREADSDDRLPDREIVIGITHNGAAKAYQESAVFAVSVVNDALAGTPIVVAVDPVSQAVKFFVREVNGQTLTLDIVDQTLVDRETGSQWNFDGLGVSGAYSGTQLDEIAGLPSYWFAWVTFHPETELFRN